MPDDPGMLLKVAWELFTDEGGSVDDKYVE
jgi:hypothetical protein